MNIEIINKQSDIKIPKRAVRKIVQAVINLEGERCDEVAVHFVKTSEICRLHDEFFSDPTTTDCITFPMDPPDTIGYRVLGEVFVCPETALHYCEKNGGDPYRETALYIVHGLLHLMGYRDMETKDKRKMRAAEKRHMAHLDDKSLNLKEPEV